MANDPSVEAVPDAKVQPESKVLPMLENVWLAKLLAALLMLGLLLVLLGLAVKRSSRFTEHLNTVWTANLKAAQFDPQQLITVRRGEILHTILLDGELRALRSRTVFADTSEEAKITWLPPEGTLVKTGERLAELDSTAILTRIKDAEERLVTAENEVVRANSQQEGQLRDLQVELSRLWLAYEKAKVEARLPAEVLPRREYQEKQFTLDKAKTEYENQLAKIEQKKREFGADLQVKTIEKQKAESQLEQAKSGLKGMQLKAPADGMVLYTDHWNERRKLQIGDVVWGGLPIVQLPDLTEMEVVAQVNEVDGPKISLGNPAKVILDSYPDIEITGAVKDISQTAAKASWQAKAKVFTVVLSLDRTLAGKMKPGMSAQVAIRLGALGQQLLIPRAAARFQPESAQVTRLENANERRPVAVTILAADAKHYAVANNGALREGDRLLLPR